MTVLTIYTDNFDQNEFVVNGGMSGKAYLDIDNKLGTDFKNIDAALEYCCINNIDIQRIDFNYLTNDGIQMFKKFNIDR